MPTSTVTTDDTVAPHVEDAASQPDPGGFRDVDDVVARFAEAGYLPINVWRPPSSCRAGSANRSCSRVRQALARRNSPRPWQR